MVVIERDNGRGAPVPPNPAPFSRGVYVVDLRDVGADGLLEKTRVVDLAAIPDPDLVSLLQESLGGLWPALIAQSLASVVQDVHSGKPAWRVRFNQGQYVISTTAAWLPVRGSP